MNIFTVFGIFICIPYIVIKCAFAVFSFALRALAFTLNGIGDLIVYFSTPISSGGGGFPVRVAPPETVRPIRGTWRGTPHAFEGGVLKKAASNGHQTEGWISPTLIRWVEDNT